MPYIRPEERSRWDETLEDLIDNLDVTGWDEGDLNYIISKLLNRAWNFRSRYSMVNRVVGAMECAKLEFYRRIASPYEDEKIDENGDVYE
jgi:hypothetical protein